LYIFVSILTLLELIVELDSCRT